MAIVLIIAIIISIPFVIALFTKNDYTINREITINRSKQDVFNYIKYLKNQDNYSVWAQMDPTMKKSYRGTDAAAGFVSAWESPHKKVGTGEQEIMNIKEGERLDLKLRFIKPFAGIADAYMITRSLADNQTHVTWGFSSRMKYPMNIMLLFMNMEKMIGNDLATGLVNLKTILEK